MSKMLSPEMSYATVTICFSSVQALVTQQYETQEKPSTLLALGTATFVLIVLSLALHGTHYN